MKKIAVSFLTLACSFAFIAGAMAQDITLEASNISETGSPNSSNIPVINHIQNNTVADIDLYWSRQNVQIPTAWRTTVCDLNLCWGETVSTNSFTLPPTPAHTPGELLEVQFRPNNVAGSGSCQIAVFRSSDNAEVARASYSATAIVGTVNFVQNRFQIYPNPAVEYLALSSNSTIDAVKIDAIKLYEVTGILVKQFTVNSQTTQYNISDLQAGAYLMEVLDEKGKVLQVSPIIKKM